MLKTLLLLCLALLPSLSAAEQAPGIVLPFALKKIENATLLMQQYKPMLKVMYFPHYSDPNQASVSNTGQLVNLLYAIPNKTVPSQIIDAYKAHLTASGFAPTGTTWSPNTTSEKFSLCTKLDFCGTYSHYYNNSVAMESVVMKKKLKVGEAFVALHANQLQKAEKFETFEASQKALAKVPSLMMNEGDNYLLVSISWPQQPPENKMVPAVPVVPKKVETPPPAPPPPPAPKPETAAVITEQLKEKGKVDIYGLLFDFDKATLKEESAPTLKAIAETLKSNPKMDVVIIGHTDNVGTEDYNQKLSEARAKSVVSALVKDYVVSASRMIAGGKGLTQPVAPNDTEEGRAKNRRVEIKVQK